MTPGETFDAIQGIRGAGLGVLVVERPAALASEIADRAYVLERGCIVLSGPTAEVAADPPRRDRVPGYITPVRQGSRALAP